MLPPSRTRVLALLGVVGALVLAGCLGTAVEPAATAAASPPAALAAADGLFLHDADGLADPARAGSALPVARVHDVGFPAFEPTLGVDADGTLYYAAYGDGAVVGYGPLVLRSDDKGATWTDVSPRLPTGHLAPPETNDPYLYVDPATGRVFSFPMAPILVCAVLSWSDDKGATWETNPRGCGSTPPWDHQTLVAAKPRSASTQGYPNVLHQCANSMAVAWCSRSLDGGRTWSPDMPIPWECHSLHGHLAAAPDGTVYLPKDDCARSMIAISRDDGLTWETSRVSDVPTQDWSDPAVAVDAAGNVHYAYVTEAGVLQVTVSTDGGRTWREPVDASPPGVTAHMPSLAAGADGRIVVAYPGTEDLPKGYAESRSVKDKARWNAYLTLSLDATAENPLFQTVRATDPSDPLVRGPCGPGRCPGMVDFIDVVIGPDGRPYAAFVDACREKCATPEGTRADNDHSEGILVTLADGPLLL